MAIIDLIKGKYKIVSVVGMSKNAGKTVTLNEIIDEAMDSGTVIGLTSIGRDGERQDVVTCTEKPMIYVDRGTLIATAENLFNCSEAKLEIIEITDYHTSLGKIIIARAVTSGKVEIAGPCTNTDIKKVSEKMIDLGAELVLVDGALDRTSSASPSITESTILSTGAVLSRDMNKVIEQSIHQVNLFKIEEISSEVIKMLAEEATENKKITLISDDGSTEEVDAKTALGSGLKIGAAITDKTRYVVLPGSLVTKTVSDIIATTKYFKEVTFIIKDSTRIFINHKDWMYYKRLGLNIAVLDRINILAVTINPHSPQGYFFDPVIFRERLQSYLSPIPVINVMEGE